MLIYIEKRIKLKIMDIIQRAIRISNIDVNVYNINIYKTIERPKSDYGDFSFPCFSLASFSDKTPNEVASILSDKVNSIIKTQKLNMFSNVKQIGPYINFFLDKKWLAINVLNDTLKRNYGSRQVSKDEKKRIMVEYSSPNTNKPLHLGHLRNDTIGMALSKVLEFYGHKVIKATLLNDKGLPIFKVIVALQKLSQYKNPKEARMKSDHFVGWLYVLFERKAKQEPKLVDEAQLLMKKYKTNAKIRYLWKKINNWTLQGMQKTYKIFGSHFDKNAIFKESQFSNKATPLINRGIEQDIFIKQDNAIIAKLGSLPDKVVLKQGGIPVYITTDIALTPYKFEHFTLDKSIWVVGNEQKLYFQQLFKILELLGYDWAKQDKSETDKQCIHLAYGMVLLPEGKMKSREGKVVDADDLIDKVTETASQELEERYNLKKQELAKRSLKIALAAIKFYLLKVDCMKDVLFDPKKAIDFEGFTGPYLLYSYARANSILKKIKGDDIIKAIQPITRLNVNVSDLEFMLIKKIMDFPSVIETAAKTLKPDIIAVYAYKLAQTFSEFYHSAPVIHATKKSEMLFRLRLVIAFRHVMELCLKLMNMPRIEEM